MAPDAGIVGDVPVGLPPWPGTWPTGEQYSPELLRDGDTRNVADEFRYWTETAIRAELDNRLVKQPKLWIAIENLHHDFNIGSIVRTANAFNVAGVYIVGGKRWNRRGAMVTDRYLHITHVNTAPELQQKIQHAPQHAVQQELQQAPQMEIQPGIHYEAQHEIHYDRQHQVHREGQQGANPIPIIGIDNIPGSIPIETYAFPPECLLVFGQESTGLTPEMQAICQDIVHITQYGSTRSINAGAAAAIAMFAWSSQNR